MGDPGAVFPSGTFSASDITPFRTLAPLYLTFSYLLHAMTFNRPRLFIALFALLPLLTASALYAQDKDRPRLTLESIHASGMFAGSYFEGGRWAEEGPVLLYIDQEPSGSKLVRYNLEKDERSVVLDGSALFAAILGLINRGIRGRGGV